VYGVEVWDNSGCQPYPYDRAFEPTYTAFNGACLVNSTILTTSKSNMLVCDTYQDGMMIILHLFMKLFVFVVSHALIDDVINLFCTM
jgi:hypothetical protein